MFHATGVRGESRRCSKEQVVAYVEAIEKLGGSAGCKKLLEERPKFPDVDQSKLGEETEAAIRIRCVPPAFASLLLAMPSRDHGIRKGEGDFVTCDLEGAQECEGSLWYLPEFESDENLSLVMRAERFFEVAFMKGDVIVAYFKGRGVRGGFAAAMPPGVFKWVVDAK